MALSKKLSKLSPSMTMVVAETARQMKAQGIDVISFSTGEPDYHTPDAVKEVGIQAIRDNFTKYCTANGIPELKQAICRKLKRENGLDYEPANIVVANGAKQIIFQACAILLDEGDEVIIPTPCWVSYVEQVKLFGGVPVLPACREENGFRLTADIVEAAITPKTKALIICSPNNPSGAIIEEEELRKIAELAVKHDFYVISDEVYENLAFDGKKNLSIAAFGPEIKERTLTVNSLSKTYCMTGWRVGYLAADKAVAKAMSSVHGHVTGNVNSPTQKAAAFAMDNIFDFTEMCADYQQRRDFVMERLGRIPGLTCTCPDGAFYVFPNVQAFFGKSYNGTTVNSAAEMAEYLLKEAHVALVPGEAFEMPGYIRITFAVDMKLVAEGLDRIADALAKLQ